MKNKNKRIILVIISFIFIFFFFVRPNISPNINLNPKEYKFQISSDTKEGHLHDLFLRYDFEKNQGDFSFYIYGKDMTWLHIYLPEEINITSYSIKDSEENEEIICYINGEGYGLQCPNPPNEKNIAVLINITEKSEENPFYPNGYFYFYSPLLETYSKYFKERKSRDLLIFNFGGKYRCSEKCLTKEMNSFNLTYNTNKDFFRIYTLPGSDDKLGTFNRFVINTYNFKKEKTSEIWLTVGVSLLAGLILILFQMLEDINLSKPKKYILHLLKNLFK